MSFHGSIDFGAIGSGIVTGVYWAFALGVGGVLAFFAYRYFQWNVRVIIHRGRDEIKTWGKEIRKKGGKVLGFKIKGYKKYTGGKVPEDYFTQEIYGLGQSKRRKKVHFKMTAEGDLIPQRPVDDYDGADWQMLSNPAIQSFANTLDDIEEEFDVRGFWEKYGQMVMMAGLAAIMLVAFFFAGDFLNGVTDAASGATASCTEALTTCREICSNAQSLAAGGGAVV